MTSPELLFEQVVRNPDDDAPRLAYADAIAAAEPERAELIRLQVSRFRDERARGVPRDEPGRREAVLLARHGAAWATTIAPFARAARPDAPFQGYGYERGFVARLYTDPAVIAAQGDQLVAMAPIQHLDLTARGPFVAALTAPCLGQMRSLIFNQLGLTDDDAIALAERGHLERCEWLDLSLNRIGPRGLAALLANPVIRAMKVVLMSGNPVDPALMVSHDGRGSIIVDGLPADGEVAEETYGRIDWLHLVKRDLPDRFHATAARPVS
jgi:uncharacterized protein (TIGR02996 family)